MKIVTDFEFGITDHSYGRPYLMVRNTASKIEATEYPYYYRFTGWIGVIYSSIAITNDKGVGVAYLDIYNPATL